MRSWEDERLLRRPPQEDSRRHRTGHAQGPGRSHLRRESLLGQALCQDRPSGRATHAQEEPRTAPQGRRESHGPARARCRGASERHHLSEAAFLGAHNGNGSERLPRKAPYKEVGLLPKRRTVGSLERDEFLRAAWRVMLAEQVKAERLVFVDEMGTNTALSPLYGWSEKGRRAHCSVSRNRGKNTTVLSSMSVEGMGPSLAMEGATTAAVFETYLERVLGPSLRKGRVVVMDNLSTHKRERVRELIEGRGCELLYLPPYSPDLNPIEEAFSKIKGLSCAKPKPVAEKPC